MKNNKKNKATRTTSSLNGTGRVASHLKNTAAIAVVSLSSLGLMDAIAAVTTLDIIARIIRAVEITVNSSMDFGTLAITGTRVGKATIDPLSNNLFIDSRSSLALSNGLPRAGRLHIRGVSAPISVSMENTKIHLTNGTTFLTVDDFGFATDHGRSGEQITVTPTGTQDTIFLSIGATINTREGQVTGTYIGANRIFANYQ